MGQRNFLVEGVSGSGKTAVCDELLRRGYHALHGDRVLRPDRHMSVTQTRPTPETATARQAAALTHSQGVWDAAKVLSHINDRKTRWSFFCGGFRNHADLMAHFDGVFILEVDRETLMERLSRRPRDEFGGRPEEQDLILDLHRTKADMPKTGLAMDATAPLKTVVDKILAIALARAV